MSSVNEAATRSDVVAGLCRNGMSVTCSFDWQGDQEWWITKESGVLPGCSDRTGGGCSCGPRRGSAESRRSSYFTIVLQGMEDCKHLPCVGFGRLSSEGVRRLGCVLKELRCTDRKCSLGWTGTEVVREDFRVCSVQEVCCRVGQEVFFRESVCECEVRAGLLTSMMGDDMNIIWQERFDGGYPLGENHWFKGVTESVGSMSLMGTKVA